MKNIMEKLNSIIAKVLGIKETEIKDETSPADVENWDSFNNLVLVSEIEKEFKIKLTMDEVASIKSVKDIKEILKKHGEEE